MNGKLRRISAFIIVLVKLVLYLFAIFLTIIFLFFAYQAVPSRYSAEPISAVVVDSHTGKPVPGVAVLATWLSQSPGFHSQNNELFEMQEATTDAQGRFVIPGWKSKWLTRFAGSITTDQPKLELYKYGYKPERRHNMFVDSDKKAKGLHGSLIEWHGAPVIPLELMAGTDEEVDLRQDYKLYPKSVHRGCNWKKTINFTLEVDKHYEQREKYFAELYKDDHRPELESRYAPWYLNKGYPPQESDCPGAIEILSNARKLRAEQRANSGADKTLIDAANSSSISSSGNSSK